MGKTENKLRIFSALEVAKICGVVNQTAINWIKNGYLKGFTTPGGQYRVYAEDLLHFLDERGMKIPDDLVNLLNDDVQWNTVLIVDDDKDINDLLKRYIEKHLPSFRVLQAYDGFEAGSIIAENRPGYVFLDIDLPGIDGHRLCKKIKEDPNFGKPFVIAITGLDIPEEEITILQDGADAFFAKPLDFEKICKTIKTFATQAGVIL